MKFFAPLLSGVHAYTHKYSTQTRNTSHKNRRKLIIKTLSAYKSTNETAQVTKVKLQAQIPNYLAQTLLSILTNNAYTYMPCTGNSQYSSVT